MVKAKDFWQVVCSELDYRFFSGVACPGLVPLYKTMTPDFMHYVPAANERIALGLVSGAYMGGFKGGLLIDGQFLSDIERVLRFNIDHKIPLLIVSYGTTIMSKKIPSVILSDLDSIRKLDKHYNKKLSPIQLVIGEGSIK